MDHIKKIEEMEASEIPLGKLVLIISRSNFYYLKKHLKDLDLKGYQITMLFEIYKGKNLSQHEIGSHYNIDKGVISRTLRKLEEDGLISREIDETNRRRNIVSLTKEGEKAIEEIINIFNKWEDEIYEDIDIEKDVLHEVLKTIAIKSIAMTKE
ncbi:MAG: MarR family transcriptional regulator [Methanobacteriaceae archaeon]|nr:MarR family transcriptional regulator [Methanobacteriaceae archaeon]